MINVSMTMPKQVVFITLFHVWAHKTNLTPPSKYMYLARKVNGHIYMHVGSSIDFVCFNDFDYILQLFRQYVIFYFFILFNITKIYQFVIFLFFL